MLGCQGMRTSCTASVPTCAPVTEGTETNGCTDLLYFMMLAPEVVSKKKKRRQADTDNQQGTQHLESLFRVETR